METSGTRTVGPGMVTAFLLGILLFIASLLPPGNQGRTGAGALHRLDSRLTSLARALAGSASPGMEGRVRRIARENPFVAAINRILPGENIVPLFGPGTGGDTVSFFRKPGPEALEQKIPRTFSEKGARPFLTAPFPVTGGKPGYSLLIPCAGNGFMEMVFTAQGVFGKGSPFLGTIGSLRVMDGDTLVFASPDSGKKGACSSIPVEAPILNRTLHLHIPLDLQPFYIDGQKAGCLLFLLAVVLLHLHGASKGRGQGGS